MLVLTDRFWSKVEKTESCWLWTAYRDAGGYGRFWILQPEKKRRLAHRVAFEALVGPVPAGFELDHTCHVRNCVNPSHLRIVTRKQNVENLAGARRDNKSSGLRGVSWHRRVHRWQVQVQHAGTKYFGGYFDDLDDAEAAAVALRNRLFTHNDADRQVGAA